MCVSGGDMVGATPLIVIVFGVHHFQLWKPGMCRGGAWHGGRIPFNSIALRPPGFDCVQKCARVFFKSTSLHAHASEIPQQG